MGVFILKLRHLPMSLVVISDTEVDKDEEKNGKESRERERERFYS